MATTFDLANLNPTPSDSTVLCEVLGIVNKQVIVLLDLVADKLVLPLKIKPETDLLPGLHICFII